MAAEGPAKRRRDGAGRHRRGGDRVRPARPRRRRLPDRHQVEDGADASRRPQIHRLQRRRGRQRHLRRPDDHGRRSLRADRGHGDRRHRRRRDQGLRLYPLGISARDRDDDARRSRSPREAGLLGTSRARLRPRPSTWRSASAPAPMSAARRRRCWKPRGQARHRARQAAAAGAQGLFGKPTVINNVLSLASVPFILAEGAGLLHDFGMGRSRGTMPIQLAGNVKHGGLFETAFGITLGELVDEIGGGTATRPAGAGRAGRRPARRLFPARAVRHAVRLRGVRRQGRPDRPWRHRRVRRHRRHGEAGALRHGILRGRKLRQVHALPHRLDPRRRDGRQDRPGRRAGEEPRPGRRSLQHDEVRLALRAGRLHALSGDERAHPFPRGFPPGGHLVEAAE